jgi:hypothetical protein
MMQTLDGHRLGETPGIIPIADSREAGQASLALARQARRTVEIVSRHLDPRLYDTADFVAALQRFCLGSRRARVRVLVQDVNPILRDGHRLVALAQRLPTFFQVRVPAPEHRGFNEAFLVADGTGYLHRRLADRFEGTASFRDPLAARGLLRRFEPLWESAAPDPSLRELKV